MIPPFQALMVMDHVFKFVSHLIGFLSLVVSVCKSRMWSILVEQSCLDNFNFGDEGRLVRLQSPVDGSW